VFSFEEEIISEIHQCISFMQDLILDIFDLENSLEKNFIKIDQNQKCEIPESLTKYDLLLY